MENRRNSPIFKDPNSGLESFRRPITAGESVSRSRAKYLESNRDPAYKRWFSVGAERLNVNSI
jgi:hypothetical protein